MSKLKILVVDLVIIFGVIVLDLIIASLTKINLSDLLFYEFGIAMFLAAGAMTISRKQMRKSLKSIGKEEKETLRKEFRDAEIISFNVAIVAAALMGLAMITIPK